MSIRRWTIKTDTADNIPSLQELYEKYLAYYKIGGKFRYKANHNIILTILTYVSSGTYGVRINDGDEHNMDIKDLQKFYEEIPPNSIRFIERLK